MAFGRSADDSNGHLARVSLKDASDGMTRVMMFVTYGRPA